MTALFKFVNFVTFSFQDILAFMIGFCTFYSARSPTFVAGHDLKNVTTLRSVEDAQLIAAQGKEKDVVIIGTSFIGK